MKSDFVLAQEELSRIGIKRVAADFYSEPKKRGSIFFVKSPATHDKTASLALYSNNKFCDFANGNKSGDIIGFVAYVRGCNNWQALKELQAFYGLSGSREREREEAQRRIQRQQAEERYRAERKQAFYAALFDEIDRLNRWVEIFTIAIEKPLYEPFSELWAYCINERQLAEYRLDILTAADMNTYRRMKYSDDLRSDRPQWILDCLSILSACDAFQATESETKEIRRAAVEGGRCKVDW